MFETKKSDLVWSWIIIGLTIAALGNPAMYVSLGIFALTVTLAFWKKVHPIWLILISAVLGIAWGHLSPLFL